MNLPGPLAALQAFARPHGGASQPAAEAAERCELCSAALGPRHDHLVSPRARALRCACAPCALLFDRPGGEWLRAPEVAERLALDLTDGDWASLRLPIALAFFVRGAAGGVRAVFPSPAGPTDAEVPAELWAGLAARNPRLAALAPDTEALLANRLGPKRDHYRVSIADCYALVGVVRAHWRGLGGGPEVWGQVAAFFDRLEARCRG